MFTLLYKLFIGLLREICIIYFQNSIYSSRFIFSNFFNFFQIALTGKNFCSAAWNGMSLMMKNIGTFGTVSSVGFIFSFLGIIFITAANGLLMFAILNYIPQFQGLVNNWIAPVILASFEGLICGTMVMSVYSFGSDTIL